MADELLTAIDAAFASRASIARSATTKVVRFVATETQAHAAGDNRVAFWRNIHWIEVFVAAQFLWGALLFIPGAQQYRGIVRALPYLSSLGLLGIYLTRRVPLSLPRGSGLLLGALVWLVLNLFHPTTQMSAGFAQCIFQFSIAAPLLWSYKSLRSTAHLGRILLLVFIMNAVSAGLGVLQVYYPDRFMPPEFSSLGVQLNRYYVDGLTYFDNNGRAIVRPPGLTDQPGGAAVAGALTALIGLGFLMRTRRPLATVGILAAVGVGLAVIYLTQVRSVLLMALAASMIMTVVAFCRGRVVGASWILLAGTGLVVASFLWASSLGGDSVDDRFLTLRGRGAIQAYQDNRGTFLAYTVGQLLNEFPLGAGVGRWGMMNAYFGNPASYRATPIYVEIQLTGWLLDGGVPMWLLYGGAILLSLWSTFQFTAARFGSIADMALIVLAAQMFVVGMSFASPPFNTQLGILFWMLPGLLHGVSAAEAEEEFDEANA